MSARPCRSEPQRRGRVSTRLALRFLLAAPLAVVTTLAEWADWRVWSRQWTQQEIDAYLDALRNTDPRIART